MWVISLQVVKGGNGSEGKDVDTYFDMLETAGAQRGRPEDLQPMQSRSVAFTGRSRKVQVILLQRFLFVELEPVSLCSS